MPIVQNDFMYFLLFVNIFVTSGFIFFCIFVLDSSPVPFSYRFIDNTFFIIIIWFSFYLIYFLCFGFFFFTLKRVLKCLFLTTKVNSTLQKSWCCNKKKKHKIKDKATTTARKNWGKTQMIHLKIPTFPHIPWTNKFNSPSV